MNKHEKFATYNEIFGQKESIKSAFDKYRDFLCNFNKNKYETFEDNESITTVFAGCGSSYYLSQCISASFNKITGHPSYAVPASEIFLSADNYLRKSHKYRLITVSRSATTSETVEASRFFKNKVGGKVVAISCRSLPPINEIADLILYEESSMEESVVMTKSFSTMLIIALMITAHIGNSKSLFGEIGAVVKEIKRVINESSKLSLEISDSIEIDRLFYLGNGPFYGISNEGMLKAKEMSLTFSESYHFLELRHGPMSMVTDSSLIIGLVSKNNPQYQVSVLRDMKALGAKIMTISDDVEQLGNFKPDYSYFLKTGLSDEVSCVLVMPFLQFFAFYCAIKKGLDVDRPRNLVQVVRL
ncbi:MAG: SIS domain-containing protein [Actinobacteria bacterium]|nr:SIS domain-containing protein [Actinomycetota bacterium]